MIYFHDILHFLCQYFSYILYVIGSLLCCANSCKLFHQNFILIVLQHESHKVAKVSLKIMAIRVHTVAIWPFTFHENRLFLVDLDGQFQTTLPPKAIKIFIWKFRTIFLIFLLFFAGVVKSSAFCTLLMLFPKGWIIWVTFLRQIAIQLFQLFGSTVCKKHWIWQLLQKIEGKWE